MKCRNRWTDIADKALICYRAAPPPGPVQAGSDWQQAIAVPGRRRGDRDRRWCCLRSSCHTGPAAQRRPGAGAIARLHTLNHAILASDPVSASDPCSSRLDVADVEVITRRRSPIWCSARRRSTARIIADEVQGACCSASRPVAPEDCAYVRVRALPDRGEPTDLASLDEDSGGDPRARAGRNALVGAWRDVPHGDEFTRARHGARCARPGDEACCIGMPTRIRLTPAGAGLTAATQPDMSPDFYGNIIDGHLRRPEPRSRACARPGLPPAAAASSVSAKIVACGTRMLRQPRPRPASESVRSTWVRVKARCSATLARRSARTGGRLPPRASSCCGRSSAQRRTAVVTDRRRRLLSRRRHSCLRRSPVDRLNPGATHDERLFIARDAIDLLHAGCRAADVRKTRRIR